MNRISVTGNSGSGKSTFALALGTALGMPVVHLDELYWRADGTPVPEDRFAELVADALSGQRWVCEGFHIPTFHLRARRADTIVVLDLPPWLCVLRLLRSRDRPGVPPSKRRMSARDFLMFLRWVWIYPRDRREGTLAEAMSYSDSKDVAILRSRRDVRRFLSSVARCATTLG